MIIKGQKINDRYEIIKMIGEGGMANVYLAYDTILDRNVAVKILRGDLASDEKFVRRFQREAISASSLSHPNIVEMYDVGEDDGKYYIVMEYVDGKTLKNMIKRRGALALSEVIDIMLQLTSGVACAHNSYIIHRDIKPQNVLITDDGTVKITDFGIAMALNSNELTQTNSVMGSVHYLPPEQANGSGSTIKSDIYSLGILMYELITGKIPFKGENAVEIAIKQMSEPIPSVREIDSSIPQSIENIILKACAKNPKNRYETAGEMYDDIKTSLDENRKDEAKVVYKYDEKELDETKKIKKVDGNKETDNKVDDDESLFGSDKKSFNKLFIAGSIILGIVILAFIIFGIIIPKAKNKEVVIPNVENMTYDDAIEKLNKAGLDVSLEDVKEYSSKVPEGNVIETNPKKNKTVRKGTTVTLIVSKGIEGIVAENYVGELYLKIEASLEAKGINVLSEEIEYSEKELEEKNLEDGKIIDQDIKEGEIISTGDTIVFKVAKKMVAYPNFVEDGYTLEQAKSFCDDNGVVLEVVEKETNDYPEGTIISQSRAADTKVVANVTLTITIAKPLPKVNLTGIKINNGNVRLGIGKTINLDITYTPATATDKTTTYVSSDKNVATVDSNGKITTIAPGECTITATSNSYKDQITIIVVESE